MISMPYSTRGHSASYGRPTGYLEDEFPEIVHFAPYGRPTGPPEAQFSEITNYAYNPKNLLLETPIGLFENKISPTDVLLLVFCSTEILKLR